jgi:hypothetical protein
MGIYYIVNEKSKSSKVIGKEVALSLLQQRADSTEI